MLCPTVMRMDMMVVTTKSAVNRCSNRPAILPSKENISSYIQRPKIQFPSDSFNCQWWWRIYWWKFNKIKNPRNDEISNKWLAFNWLMIANVNFLRFIRYEHKSTSWMTRRREERVELQLARTHQSGNLSAKRNSLKFHISPSQRILRRRKETRSSCNFLSVCDAENTKYDAVCDAIIIICKSLRTRLSRGSSLS